MRTGSDDSPRGETAVGMTRFRVLCGYSAGKNEVNRPWNFCTAMAFVLFCFELRQTSVQTGGVRTSSDNCFLEASDHSTGGNCSFGGYLVNRPQVRTSINRI